MDKKRKNWIALVAFLWMLFGAVGVITFTGHTILYHILFGLGYLFASVSLFAVIASHRRSTMLITYLKSRWIQALVVLIIFALHAVAFLLTYSLAFLVFLWVIGFLSPFLLVARSEKQLVDWTVRIFLVVLPIIITTYALETSLRLSAANLPLNDLPFNGIKDGVHYTWGHEVVNNSFGFREREFVIPKPSDVYRVMVLGDSFTWGAGLSERERYSNRLEALLSSKYPDKEIEVLNFALPALATTTERDILMRHWHVVQPDLVIVGFCFNDPQPVPTHGYCSEEERYRSHFLLIEQLKRFGLREVSLFLSNRYDELLHKFGRIPRWTVCLQRTYDKGSLEWKEFEVALRDIKDLSDALALRPPVFAVLNNGTSNAMATDYNHPDEQLEIYLKWWHQAEDTARGIGFTTVNFEEEFKQELFNEIMAVNISDGHPSSRMNEIYARELLRVVSPVVVDNDLR